MASWAALTQRLPQVPNFFDLKYEPQLAAVCPQQGSAEAFAEQWGYESVETDWKKLIARDDIGERHHSPNNVTMTSR